MYRAAVATALTGCLALAACSSAPSLPPADQERYPAPQETPDWEAWGENRPDQPPTSGRGTGGPVQVIGTRLSGEDIRRTLSGQTLNGCYPNGERFSERLDQDGRFYDAQNGQQLGTWSVKSDALCFDYPQQGESCFPVSREGNDLFFYAQDFSGIVAATRCS